MIIVNFNKSCFFFVTINVNTKSFALLRLNEQTRRKSLDIAAISFYTYTAVIDKNYLYTKTEKN